MSDKTSAAAKNSNKQSFINRLSSLLEQKRFIMLISAFIGGLLFALIYGVRILDPTYEDWLFEGGDLTQHYLGWVFFRRSGWHFPFGLNDSILGDIKISVMFTDSVPVLAIFFKLLSPILPKTFQYFGFMGLSTFMLNGSCASLLIHRFNKNGLFCILGSTLYTVCPAILQRLYGHEALACHYIITLGLVLWVYQNHEWKKKWQTYAIQPILWGALGIIAVSIHIYYLPMLYCFLLGCCVTDIFRYKKYLRPSLCIVSITVSSLITMWMIGAFYTKSDTAAYGLGIYSANINTFWNPIEVGGNGLIGDIAKGSTFLKAKPVNFGHYEGYAYIGLGIMAGILFALMTFANHILSRKGNPAKTAGTVLIKRRAWIIAGLIVFFVSFFYAVSPSCYINETKIYDIYYPESIIKLMSSFRATGRYAWVGMYLIFTIVIYCLSRIRTKALMLSAIAVCVGLQFTDMKDQIRSRKWFKEEHTYSSILTDPRWEQLAEGCDKFVGLSYDQPQPYIYAFSIFAYKHNMTINHFHIARPPFYDIIDQYNNTMERLSNGSADMNTLYVFLSDEYIPEVEGTKIYELDGFYVVKFANQPNALEDN